MGGSLKLCDITSVNGDLAAFGHETLCGFLADARPTAGDRRDFVFEAHDSSPIPIDIHRALLRTLQIARRILRQQCRLQQYRLRDLAIVEVGDPLLCELQGIYDEIRQPRTQRGPIGVGHGAALRLGAARRSLDVQKFAHIHRSVIVSLDAGARPASYKIALDFVWLNVVYGAFPDAGFHATAPVVAGSGSCAQPRI